MKKFPQAAWHVYEPADDAARAGAALAYGRPLAALPRLDQADVVLTLDADPLGPGPDQLRNARGWAARRDPQGPNPVSRLYAIEAEPTLTAAKADNRLALHPSHIHNAALAVANALGAGLPQPALPPQPAKFVDAAVRDLAEQRGRSLVLAGRILSPEAHALVHWINAQLQAPVDLIEPPDVFFDRRPESLETLAQDLAAGRVEALVVIGANPAYDAPADLEMAARLKRAPFSVHLGLYADETAALCGWHVPESHPLESWSDLRATDGTASLVQPLIRPLYATRTAHELLAAFSGRFDAASHALVRETWAATGGGEFETWWRQVLHDGVVVGSAAKPAVAGAPRLPAIQPLPEPNGLSIVLGPDPCVWDGRFANNAWLQECPKPITKEVWGNALGIGPTDAQKLGLKTGDEVRIAANGASLVTPVVVTPGHAPGVASLTLGYGRTRAGVIGTGVGANAALLRTTRAPWIVEGVALAKTGRRREVLVTQNYVRLERDVRDLFPVLSVADLAQGKSVESNTGPYPSFYPNFDYTGHAWGMVIDAQACIGCNACVVACQTENNVPVVGPEEIAQGRDMHWLRIDIYDHGTPEKPHQGFQPVPCMHCERAPCEPVCPVAASVHDGEGLNVQVYNRCVGTRFCEANCPYKVRRFNFFGYADGQEYGNLGARAVQGAEEPRGHGPHARGDGEVHLLRPAHQPRPPRGRDARTVPSPAGAVTTACQDACPTRAIVFGDLNNPGEIVRDFKTGPRHYALLGDLNTRPRTTYLADLKNPNPALDGDGG